MPTLTVTSPFDGHTIKTLPYHDDAAIEKKLVAAQRIFQDRSQWLPAHERINILTKLHDLIRANAAKLTRQAAEEGGKPFTDSQIEVSRAMQGVTVAIEEISRLTGEQVPMQLTSSSMQRLAYTLREPVGPVFSISAFNHPVNLIIHQIVPAIAVGCPVIVKPASSTPLSCIKLVELTHQAGLPEAWCQYILCKNKQAQKIVSDPRIRFLSFIGSSKVGWFLRSQLAPGARCTLEHGGAAPVIIEPDADIDDALPLLVKGGFYHAGQVCVSVQRVFIHESLCDEVAEKIASLARQLRVGDPLDSETEVGPLIDPKEVDRIATWVNNAVKSGAKLLCGGKKISDTCYQPTVLRDPPDDAEVSRHEIFGPVVCLYRYTDRHKAYKRANQLPFCFQASIFTKHLDTALEAIQHLKGNTILINDHTAFRVDWMPFAGSEASGLGTGGIPYSMHDLTQEKLFVIRSPAL